MEKPPAKALTSEEKQAMLEDVQKIVAAFDKDKDGKLDAEELKELKRHYESEMKKHRRSREQIIQKLEAEVKEHHEQIARKHALLSLHKRYDKDRDGTLTLDELLELQEDIKTTDTVFRVGGYAGPLARAVRYLAYTSDLGESFRPVVHGKVVTASYAVSWAYVFGDVAYEGWKEKTHHKQPDNVVANVVARRTVFQVLASIVVPAVVIHTQVHLFQKILKRVGRFQKWGPSAAGLAMIPLLPYADHPVEHGVDRLFNFVWPLPKDHYSLHERKEHAH